MTSSPSVIARRLVAAGLVVCGTRAAAPLEPDSRNSVAASGLVDVAASHLRRVVARPPLAAVKGTP